MTFVDPEGDFEPLTAVKKAMEDKPEALAQLLENAPRRVHPHTKEEHIWVMKLSLSSKDEEVLETTKKRVLESSQAVQGVKKPKEAKKAKEESQGSLVAPLSESQLKKITKLLPAGEEKKLEVSHCKTARPAGTPPPNPLA